jgi:hypothetical protein
VKNDSGDEVVTRIGYDRVEVTKRRPDGVGVQVDPQRAHRPGDRTGDLMSTETTETAAPRALPRLKQRYREEIVPALQQEFQFANVMQIPGLVKIVVNMASARPRATPS